MARNGIIGTPTAPPATPSAGYAVVKILNHQKPPTGYDSDKELPELRVASICAVSGYRARRTIRVLVVTVRFTVTFTGRLTMIFLIAIG